MDGLANVAGAGSEVELQGKRYRLAPFTLGIYAQIEAHLLAKRPNALKALAETIDGFSKDQQKYLMDAAIARATQATVSSEEVNEYIGSFDGLAFIFYLLVHDHHPEIGSPLEALDVISGMRPGEEQMLKGAIDRAGGLDQVKNSPSQPTEPSPSDPHESRGLAYIDS